MPNDKPKKVPVFNSTNQHPADADEIAMALNAVINGLNDHLELMGKMAKAMSSMTDMLEKHNVLLKELKKRVMPFEAAEEQQ